MQSIKVLENSQLSPVPQPYTTNASGLLKGKDYLYRLKTFSRWEKLLNCFVVVVVVVVGWLGGF